MLSTANCLGQPGVALTGLCSPVRRHAWPRGPGAASTREKPVCRSCTFCTVLPDDVQAEAAVLGHETGCWVLGAGGVMELLTVLGLCDTSKSGVGGIVTATSRKSDWCHLPSADCLVSQKCAGSTGVLLILSQSTT